MTVFRNKKTKRGQKSKVGAQKKIQQRQLTFGSCFSGIGGFTQGFASEGFQVKFICESDTVARESWMKNHENALPIVVGSDFLTMPLASFPKTDVLCIRLPSQSISNVGPGQSHGADLDDSTQQVIEKISQVVRAREFRAVAIETVKGILALVFDK